MTEVVSKKRKFGEVSSAYAAGSDVDSYTEGRK